MVRGLIKLIEDAMFVKDVKIIYDETEVDKNKLLSGCMVDVEGNDETEIEILKNYITENQGFIKKNKDEVATKYIYVCNLKKYENSNDKWNEWIKEIKNSFFSTQQFAVKCINKGLRASIVHMVIYHDIQEKKIYENMVKGFAKSLGKKFVRVNALFTSIEFSKDLFSTAFFLLDRHSAHMSGECFDLETH